MLRFLCGVADCRRACLPWIATAAIAPSLLRLPLPGFVFHAWCFTQSPEPSIPELNFRLLWRTFSYAPSQLAAAQTHLRHAQVVILPPGSIASLPSCFE
jgi:hypothetical protein